MSVVRDSQKFLGHPYVGHIARSSLRQLSFLVNIYICCFMVVDMDREPLLRQRFRYSVKRIWASQSHRHMTFANV